MTVKVQTLNASKDATGPHLAPDGRIGSDFALHVSWQIPLLGIRQLHARGLSAAVLPIAGLVKILLVIVFGIVESGRRNNLCGDLVRLAAGCLVQRALVSIPRSFRQNFLLLCGVVDTAAILRARVRALAVALCRVVRLPKSL